MAFWNRSDKSKPSAEESFWRPLSELSGWEAVLADSQDQSQWVLKHSPRCGISLVVKRRLESRLKKWGVHTDRYLLDVVRDQGLSQRVARDLNLAHQSPQLLVIRNGEVVWSASHYDILDIDPDGVPA